MNFKLFGLTWNFKPILVFVWFMILLALLCVFLVGAFGDNVVLAMVGFFACMLWVYITSTFASNGKI